MVYLYLLQPLGSQNPCEVHIACSLCSKDFKGQGGESVFVNKELFPNAHVPKGWVSAEAGTETHHCLE